MCVCTWYFCGNQRPVSREIFLLVLSYVSSSQTEILRFYWKHFYYLIFKWKWELFKLERKVVYIREREKGMFNRIPQIPKSLDEKANLYLKKWVGNEVEIYVGA